MINKVKIIKKCDLDLLNFIKKHNVSIFYEGIDYLTVKIEFNNSNIDYIINNLYTVYNHKIDICNNNFDNIELFDNIKILDKFYLINLWLVFWWQLRLFWIYDFYKNKIWSFVYKLPWLLKKNFNVFTSLELTGLFFHNYKDYFDSILNYFWVDRFSNWILKRLDYCIDLINIEVPQLLEFLKPLHKRQRVKNVNWLTNSDLKLLQEKNFSLQFWKTETYKKFINNSNTLIIYDKILDIVDNYLLRQIDWKNPYKEYLDSNFPITRVELKKTTSSFSKIRNHSVNSMIDNIRPLFFDYLKRYFVFDFSLLTWQKVSLNWKKRYLAQEKKEIDILRSLQMAKSYLKRVEIVCGKEYLYKFILSLYPELEGINSLDLLDDFERFDYAWSLFNSE